MEALRLLSILSVIGKEVADLIKIVRPSSSAHKIIMAVSDTDKYYQSIIKCII